MRAITTSQVMLEAQVIELRGIDWTGPSTPQEVARHRLGLGRGFTQSIELCQRTLIPELADAHNVQLVTILVSDTGDDVGRGHLREDGSKYDKETLIASWDNLDEAPIEICKAWVEAKTTKGPTP